LPDADVAIQSHLEGWFEATALQRLFSLQQRPDALNALAQTQDQAALSALIRLALVGGLPLLGILFGTSILVFWLVWIAWKKQNAVGPAWAIPWDAVQIQVVLTGWFLGFLTAGWLVPRLYVTTLQIQPTQLSYWQQSIQLLLTYVAGAAVGLILIHRVTEWKLIRFKLFDNWPLWGIGGYLVALPVVVVAAALAQFLLPQGGGGNPILPIILQSQGWGPRLVLLLVVSVCAPVFEEILFRGFVLASLSRYLSMWKAVVVSALLFALAHLNLADVLPLTALGIVLGVIYSQSRNLLAPMLLHSFWNAGSLVALLILGES
jgi:hypothetical protein